MAIGTVGGLKREVREIEFQSPPEPKKRRLSRSLSVFGQPNAARATEPKPVDRDKWDQVCELARQLALEVTMPEELDPLADEVERLEKYLKLRGGKSKKLADFISQLIVDDKVKLKAERWEELSTAISSQSVSRINGAMAKLAST